jgi:hypothetical protein
MRNDEIVEVLKHLPPAVAGWLVGKSPRALRDVAELRRDEAGCYDARQLLTFAADLGNRRMYRLAGAVAFDALYGNELGSPGLMG